MEDTVTEVLSSWVYTCIKSYTYIHADVHKDTETFIDVQMQRNRHDKNIETQICINRDIQTKI